MINCTISDIDLIKNQIKTAFKGLAFDEESHTYTLNGNKLVSTTTYLTNFYTKFTAYHMAKAMADSFKKKNRNCRSRDYSYYIYRWKMISDAATSSGSRVHNYAEFNYPDWIDPPSCDQEQGVIDFFDDLDSKYVVLFLELKMYLEKYNKAGTADVTLYNLESGNIVIADYKTNQSNLHQYYTNNQMKRSFKHISPCDLNKYSLQLSDYQNMIEMNTDFKVEDRWVIHLSKSKYDQFDRNKSKPKYDLDLSNPPKLIKDNYKLYSLVDYSKELREEYIKLSK
jgi:hypothetical protein